MTPRAFGEKVAASIDWKNILAGAGRGGLAGAALGGLHGLVMPGEEEEYDDYGRVIGKKQRSRFGAAIRGALSGGVLGGGTGALMNYAQPGLVGAIYDSLRRGVSGKTQAQLNTADNVARMKPEQRRLHDMYLQSVERTKNMPYRPDRTPNPPPPVMMLDPEPWEAGRQATDDEVANSELHLGDPSGATWTRQPNMGVENPNVNPNNLTDAELDELGTPQ